MSVRLRPALMAVGLVVLALALGLGYGVLTGAPPTGASGPSRLAASAPQSPVGASESRAPRGSLSRDLLRYAEEAATQAAPERVEPLGPIITLPVPPPAPAQRLIGFVRRAGQVRAALALPGGETAVLAPGDSAGAYTLVAIDDEQTSVVLRLPDGQELTLTVPD